jgi:CspA family cold shock protein
MNQGKVKWYNAAKGYGFITPDDGSKDVFVHASALRSAQLEVITEGQTISYELIESRGRTAAGNLRLI